MVSSWPRQVFAPYAQRLRAGTSWVWRRSWLGNLVEAQVGSRRPEWNFFGRWGSNWSLSWWVALDRLGGRSADMAAFFPTTSLPCRSGTPLLPTPLVRTRLSCSRSSRTVAASALRSWNLDKNRTASAIEKLGTESLLGRSRQKGSSSGGRRFAWRRRRAWRQGPFLWGVACASEFLQPDSLLGPRAPSDASSSQFRLGSAGLEIRAETVLSSCPSKTAKSKWRAGSKKRTQGGLCKFALALFCHRSFCFDANSQQ